MAAKWTPDDWDLINEALALLEAHIEDEEPDPERGGVGSGRAQTRFEERLRRVRAVRRQVGDQLRLW